MRYYIRDSDTMHWMAGLFFLLGAAEFLMSSWHHSVSGSLWHRIVAYQMPLTNFLFGTLYLLLPRVVYYELTPAKLIFRALWQRRAIPYAEIHRIANTTKSMFSVVQPVIQIEYASGKKLAVRPLEQTSFLSDLISRVPQAIIE